MENEEKKSGIEHIKLVDERECIKVIRQYPDYKFFWMMGFEWKGKKEREDDKSTFGYYVKRVWKENSSFEERMDTRFDGMCVADIDMDHDKKEIHMNGFTCNDMY